MIIARLHASGDINDSINGRSSKRFVKDFACCYHCCGDWEIDLTYREIATRNSTLTLHADGRFHYLKRLDL
jgi:hypothetical protein